MCFPHHTLKPHLEIKEKILGTVFEKLAAIQMIKTL
jgi:hypothetical protein